MPHPKPRAFPLRMDKNALSGTLEGGCPLLEFHPISEQNELELENLVIAFPPFVRKVNATC